MNITEPGRRVHQWTPDNISTRFMLPFPTSPLSFLSTAIVPARPIGPKGTNLEWRTFAPTILQSAQRKYTAGAIFFCYNDYRTHVGDRGTGVLKQRVHGVVDIFGAKKQSYELLRRESSPIESLSLENHLNVFQVTLRTRADLPMYTLRGYKLCGTFYGQGHIPVELQDVEISELPPASVARLEVKFTHSEVPTCIRFDVMRPTGFSAYSLEWIP